MKNDNGMVYLIGAGPGDPGLITLKAIECIKKADVVVYDYLASPALLKYAGKDAQIIYVGKKSGYHTMPQANINDILADKGRQGLTVARLKGGDPFIFGRGGEEAEVLIKNGIPFEIVSGVTSAVAAPAYAGIPLTHREHTSMVSLITGHEDPTKPDSSIRWDSLAQSGATLVFLMGVKNLDKITKELITCGKPPKTPVALVRWGTTPKQMTVTGTLATIVEKVKKVGLKPPAVIVVGDVVALREKMQWFDKRPLLGKRIVITRARAQASGLVKTLAELGADCLEFPTIKVVPPKDQAPLTRAIENLKNFDWLIFTSVNGVDFFFKHLFELQKDVRALGHLKFACIGPATKDELFKYGIVSDILPKTFRAESVVDAFKDQKIQGKNILLPRASKARTILPRELEGMKACVTEIFSYETIQVSDQKNALITALKDGTIDMVTFTSSSTVTNFMALLDEEDAKELLKGVNLACIGPITQATAQDQGLTIQISADTFTIPGLVDAILDFYTGRAES